MACCAGAPSNRPVLGRGRGPRLLWRDAVTTAGARLSLAYASRLGALAVPLSLAAALGALALTSSV